MNALKIKNVFGDYLKSYIKAYNKSTTYDIKVGVENETVYYTDGHIMAIVPELISPFKINENCTWSKMIPDVKYIDSNVVISGDTTNVNGIECYIVKDLFDNRVCVVNRKMLDNWFNIKECTLYMEKLDGKSPVYFIEYGKIIGLILPIYVRG